MNLREAAGLIVVVAAIAAGVIWVRGTGTPERVEATTEVAGIASEDSTHDRTLSCGNELDRPLDLHSADGLKRLETLLECRGLARSDVEHIVLAAARQRTATFFDGASADAPYWQARSSENEVAKTAQRLARLREVRDSLRAVFGDTVAESPRFEDLFKPLNESLPFLSSSKQIDLMEIREEAQTRKAELMQDYIVEREQLVAGIDEERETAIELLLGPEDYREYLLRESTLAKALVRSMRGLDHSEQEFRDIFQIHHAVKPAKTGRDGYRVLYTPAERQAIESRVREYLGASQYESYSRYSDHLFRKLETIAEHYGRSTEEVDAVYSTIQRLKRETEGTPPPERFDRLRRGYIEKLTPMIGEEMTKSIFLNTFPSYDPPDF